MAGENKAYCVNVMCPGNFSCTNDNDASDINPATGSNCVSNTTSKSADNSVARGNSIKTGQITKINNDLVDELARKRQQPKWQKSDVNPQPGEEVRFDNTLKRIKENLYRLTGYTLPVNKGDLMRASDIQTVYAKLNTSQNTCVCVERCTCNTRSAETTVADCPDRCTCDTQCKSRTAVGGLPGCNCNGDCGCHARGSATNWNWCSCDGRCGCNGRCACDGRTTVDACICDCNSKQEYICRCDTRCSCDAREAVTCNCNVRDVCVTFVNN